jgi:hypothetical protein
MFGPAGTSSRPHVCAPPGETSVHRSVEVGGRGGGRGGGPDRRRFELMRLLLIEEENGCLSSTAGSGGAGPAAAAAAAAAAGCGSSAGGSMPSSCRWVVALRHTAPQCSGALCTQSGTGHSSGSFASPQRRCFALAFASTGQILVSTCVIWLGPRPNTRSATWLSAPSCAGTVPEILL